jgi:hypothetical protein
MSREEHDEPTARSMLGRGSAWFGEAKQTLVDKAAEFGEVQDLWTSLEGEADKMESRLRQHSAEAHSAWRGQLRATVDYLYTMDPEDPGTFWDQPVTEAALFTGTATSGSAIGAAAHLLIGTDQYDDLQSRFAGFIDRRSDGEHLSRLLSRLSPHLRDEFAQAWEVWYSATKDRSKLAMYAMRDTVQAVVVQLSSPGGKFKAAKVAESRKARMRWIARNLISNASAHALVDTRAGWYPRLYTQLSDAHKLHFDQSLAHALLLEAQSFLLELLSTLDWQLVEQHGLCDGGH